jgi:uncharacterized membrane protein YuzA (DUF378 family)
MKRIFIAAIALVLSITLFSCKSIRGKGDTVTELRSIGNYSAISLCMDGDVYFTTDSLIRCEVQAQQNILDIIETYIDGNRLVIKYKDHYTTGKHEPIKFVISAPSVYDFDINGSGSIFIGNQISAPNTKFNISGSGNLNASSVNSSFINANISGSGSVTIANGNSTTETLTISGSGNMDLLGVVAANVVANISGSGNMQVHATQTLDITISGSGCISYRGTPSINQHISGSGTITNIP